MSYPTNQVEQHASRSEETEADNLRRMLALYEARLNEAAELVAHVRHEINNPLTGLIGQAQLLLRGELSDAARRRVQTIEQLATRIKETVARLSSVQRPDTAAESSGEECRTDESPRH